MASVPNGKNEAPPLFGGGAFCGNAISVLDWATGCLRPGAAADAEHDCDNDENQQDDGKRQAEKIHAVVVPKGRVVQSVARPPRSVGVYTLEGFSVARAVAALRSNGLEHVGVFLKAAGVVHRLTTLGTMVPVRVTLDGSACVLGGSLPFRLACPCVFGLGPNTLAPIVATGALGLCGILAVPGGT